MDNQNQIQDQEFDLDEILNEFHASEEDADFRQEPEKQPDDPLNTAAVQDPEEAPEAADAEPDAEEAEEVTGDTVSLGDIQEAIHQSEQAEETPDSEAQESDQIPAAESASQDPEVREEVPPVQPPLVFNPKARLRELKRKLIAGPEKRYYELSEMGLGKLQMAILLNILIVVLCASITTLHVMDLVPQNRMRFLIFSQVLAMLVSALLGSNQLLDGVTDLFKGRFSVSTMMMLTFLVCCIDAVFCLKNLRVPCCGAFSLEMTMALLARYQRRNTEMAQMDTLRKAVRLRGIVRQPDYFDGSDGLLRTEGRLEDFWNNYALPTGPEKGQCVYAFFSFLACIAIGIFAYLMHGADMGIQVLATSMLVAVPASFFVALSRPAAILERRLHMVGTVLCGWKGVKGLCGKAVFPISDPDLFPVGSTKLNGVKFYSSRVPDQIVAYLGSLMSLSQGSLVAIFNQLMANRGVVGYPVTHFQSYPSGGIGGEIGGESVLIGSSAFLQEMGVEIPEGTMVNQAVYGAIDGELCAVVAISYAKMRSASAGLVTLCGNRKLTTVLTGGDFIMTENFLRSKFGVNTRRLAFPDQQTRRTLCGKSPSPEAPALAISTREELISYGYAVTGAKSLRTACRLGMALHIVGGILGMIIMLALAYLGASELMIPSNVLLYQLVWMIPGLLITEWTRNV